jgi:hypothetical protein
MAENTKMPPNQDQRQRSPQGMPQGDANKPQKPGGPAPTGSDPDRGRQGVNNPGKPGPEMDPDRGRPDRNKPVPGKPGSIEVDDDDDDEVIAPPIDRE